MIEAFARLVVRFRKQILVLAFLLLIPSAIGFLLTGINYDILSYLPDELDSMQGEQSLENDFHIASTGLITCEGLSTAQMDALSDEIAAVPGVSKVLNLSDALDGTIPAGMLPDELQSIAEGKNNAKLIIVTFEEAAAADSTMSACTQIRQLITDGVYVGGISMIYENICALINQELPMYIVTAVLACMLVLFLSLPGTAVPPLFMLGLAFPIIYNFGSNIIFGQISYITMALAAVLQLGVTTDFSIFLLERYEEEKSKGLEKQDAMVHAICNTATAISASSLTTIAGFLALCTMKLSLGTDIGLVMAKGVALGVICTVTILPSILLQFDRTIERWKHPTLIPELKGAAKLVSKHNVLIVIVFIVLFIPFALAQSRVSVYYSLFDSMPQDMVGLQGQNRLAEDFDMESQHFLLVSDTLSADDCREMNKELKTVDGVNQVFSLDGVLGSAVPRDMLPEEVTDMLQAGGYKLVLITSTLHNGTDAMVTQVSDITNIAKSYDANALLTGESAMTTDLIEVTDVDFKNVSFASIIAVFLIIAFSFRSVSVPVILVAAIESAIYINNGIPYFTGSTVAFISNIVVGTIQLGATVDYAILTTTRFREERINGCDAREAARIAVEKCSRSILTSSFSLFAATFAMSAVSSMELLSGLCLLIARGAIISMIVIIFVLPCLLILLDKVITKTSLHWLQPPQSKTSEA